MNMFFKKSFFILIVLALFSHSNVFSHKVYLSNEKKIVQDADTIGIGKISKTVIKKYHCSTNFSYEIKVLYLIKGDSKKSKFTFSYSHYYWKKAKWPWQKDCPSVHYRVPPIAKNLKKGYKIIFTLKKLKNKSFWVTSTFDLDKMPLILKVLKKRKVF